MVEKTATKPAPESAKAPKDKKPPEEKEPELSEEDKQLQDELSMLVQRLQEPDVKLYIPALEALRTQIKASTTSMTSVPKPLKFLRPHYKTLQECYEKMEEAEAKRFCADVISILAMTISEERECLKYRLLGSREDIGSWGHEYVRHLSGEVAQEWTSKGLLNTKEEALLQLRERLLTLTNDIVPYHMKHNAEAEACDLLMEIEQLQMLETYVDTEAYPRVCLYLSSCVPYVAEPENTNILKICVNIFLKFDKFPEALRMAMQLNDLPLIKQIFLKCQDRDVQKQMAFMVGRQQLIMESLDELAHAEEINEIASNSCINDHFMALARELDIVEPKTPDDIYKSHLDNSRPTFGGSVDSARQNLASSFVNGFVNAAFGQDKLLMDDGNKWLYKNKEHGMMSATASLGVILLWNVDGGLTQIDKYLYSSEDYIKAGAILACGIVNCGVRNECDPALALLSDYVRHDNALMRIGSILGLGLAYAGSNNNEVISLLLPVLGDEKSTAEVLGIVALSLGLVAVGTCNGDVTAAILQCLLERSESDLKDHFAKFMPLGLGLCYLGKQDLCETITEALAVLVDPFKSMSQTLVEVCAYAGTGNVLKVQHFLHICSDHYEPGSGPAPGSSAASKDAAAAKDKDSKDKDATAASTSAAGKEGGKDGASTSKDAAGAAKDGGKEASGGKGDEAHVDLSSQQMMAVLGIALVAMGEDIGSEMAFRAFGHLLRYGDAAIKRAVPLALGLLSVSNPKLNILETLSKFSHDSDPEVVYSAIFGLGLAGAGTNNARLAAMLRQLAQYHAKDPNNLFMVRIAQGLTHMGKGTLTLCPYHSDRQLMSPVAVAGLLSALVACLDMKSTLLGRSHYLLYTLVAAIQPRMLVTLDEKLQNLSVAVRVGQAVDVVGQAGKPKTITGFQTHSTPVLLSYGERAELATDEYIVLTPVLEGFCILRKNPDHIPGHAS